MNLISIKWHLHMKWKPKICEGYITIANEFSIKKMFRKFIDFDTNSMAVSIVDEDNTIFRIEQKSSPMKLIIMNVNNQLNVINCQNFSSSLKQRLSRTNKESERKKELEWLIFVWIIKVDLSIEHYTVPTTNLCFVLHGLALNGAHQEAFQYSSNDWTTCIPNLLLPSLSLSLS